MCGSPMERPFGYCQTTILCDLDSDFLWRRWPQYEICPCWPLWPQFDIFFLDEDVVMVGNVDKVKCWADDGVVTGKTWPTSAIFTSLAAWSHLALFALLAAIYHRP